MNKVIINGRLTQDMEVKTNKKGTLIGSFSIANNVRRGEVEKVNFVKCYMFGDNVINALEEYLVKGCQVLLEGELQLDKVEDKTFTSLLVKRIEIEKFVDKEQPKNKSYKRR